MGLFRNDYEGYAESLWRLPESTDREAQALFTAGYDKELQEQFDNAMSLYEQALARDQKGDRER